MSVIKMIIDAKGTQRWYKDDVLHRDGDEPAIIKANGDKVWYINGNCHSRENDKPAIIDANRDKHWFINGKYHRGNDLPAIIRANGDRKWYINGKFIRKELTSDAKLASCPIITPEIVANPSIDAKGTQRWYKDDVLHRDGDEPAIIKANGTKHWYKNGKCHRDGDEPAVIYANGNKTWYKNGKCHRDGDEPAVIYANGYNLWYKNGKCHRDGHEPAVIYANGYNLWYKNGEFIRRKVASETKLASCPIIAPENSAITTYETRDDYVIATTITTKMYKLVI